MSVHDLPQGERLPVARGAVVVAIPVYGGHDLFVRCLSSVLEHTALDVPVLIADDQSPEAASRAWVDDLDARGVLKHEVFWLRQPENLGFVGNVNAAFDVCSPADVALLNSDCTVAAGWLDGLRDAAHSDSIIATATALTNHGTIVSVPYRNIPTRFLPQDMTLEESAAKVRERSLKLRPRLPTAIGHCVYIRRSAIDLAGPLDTAFAPAYGEEVDFSQRCILRGLQHVLADDVLVLHYGGASLDPEGASAQAKDAHEQLIANRYPYYHDRVDQVAEDESGPLGRALAVARQALLGIAVTIDGRSLGMPVTGTQVQTLELIHAVWRTGRVQLRIVVSPGIGEYAADTLNSLSNVHLLRSDLVSEGVRRDDVVHRPFQITRADDLPYLNLLGERLVINHLDLIAFHNPGYFRSSAEWFEYRQLTREALGLADGVCFISEHAAGDAIAEGLVPEERARVVFSGVDHHVTGLSNEPQAPAEGAMLSERPFLLCLGTNFLHKNRTFALRLFAALKERHGWEGRLVLAGPEVPEGSSAHEEAAWRLEHPELATDVINVAAVDEREKVWLYREAAAVVYPTVYEGFGFIPFEAADAGTPCFFAPQASLPEVLAGATAVIEPWDADATADRAIPYLREPEKAQALVDEVRAAGERMTWDATAERLVDVYDAVTRMPPRDALGVAQAEMTTQSRYWAFRHEIGGAGMALVDPERALLPQDAQRAVAALASKSATRKPFLGALKLAARLGNRLNAPDAPSNGSPDG